MQFIALSGSISLFAKVSDEDFGWLSEFNWYPASNGYARAAFCFPGRRNAKEVSMHRLIMCPLPDEDIDHRDRDRLNNCRENLRISTKSQNALNAKLHHDSKSGLKGVSWTPDRRKWRVDAYLNKKQIWLGYFDDKESAARRYDQFVVEKYGDFALTNKSLGLLAPKPTPE